MMAFPLYAGVLTPKPNAQAIILAVTDNRQQVRFSIHDMSCAGCELEINYELSKLNGVIAYKTSYATGSSLVTFDKTKVDVKAIEAAINKTGYAVKEYALVTEKHK